MPARRSKGSTPGKPAAKGAAHSKRSYLKHDDRRRMLLDVAANVVENRGWSTLTMSALAERAGTSRQLVYYHFPNLETLVAKTAWHIFNDTIEQTRASIAAFPDNLRNATANAEEVTLDLPPGRSDALWQLIAGTAGETPELERIRRDIRKLITDTWLPPVQRELAMDTEDARLFSWMAVMAFWGMRQLVRDGVITRARGVAAFNDLLDRLVEGSRRTD